MSRNIDIIKRHLLEHYADRTFTFFDLKQANTDDLKKIDVKQVSGAISSLDEQGLITRTGKKITYSRGGRSHEYTANVEAIRESLAKRMSAPPTKKNSTPKTKFYVEQAEERIRMMGTALDRLHKCLDNIVRSGVSA
ncbi:MAG: hypothetical protein WCT35_04780 [Sideroxydans sp.]|jgi:predicted MarR family transcription regulator